LKEEKRINFYFKKFMQFYIAGDLLSLSLPFAPFNGEKSVLGVEPAVLAWYSEPTEVLPTDPEVPGSIRSATRLSEK
jgi:hypothetical protein